MSILSQESYGLGHNSSYSFFFARFFRLRQTLKTHFFLSVQTRNSLSFTVVSKKGEKGKLPFQIKDLDFRFENILVEAVANRNYPETNLAGITIGPFEEGNEYEIYYWIAEKLAEADIVHFREEAQFGASELYKVQWKERVQIAGQISALPEAFYPRLRRYLANLKKEIANGQPEKIKEYEKAAQLALDIVNSRLKKIIALSSVSIQTDQLLKKMAAEERVVYEELGKKVTNWRIQILEHNREK
jgi:hypothetical protein